MVDVRTGIGTGTSGLLSFLGVVKDDPFTFFIGAAVGLATLIYTIYGIRTRRYEMQIKRVELERLQHGSD